jgi:Tol biopolymer transport system component
VKHERAQIVVAAAAAVTAFLGLAAPTGAVFPGANGLVLFTSDRSAAGDILAAQPDGTGLHTVVGGPMQEAQAAWAPNGRIVAFRRGPNAASDVWVANADSSGQRRLTTTSAVNSYSSQPAWSPGGRIFFRSDRDGDPDIWVMNADGSDQRVLLDLPGDQRYPTPSPDGHRIAFRSDADGDAEIWVANIDGSSARRLTDNIEFDSAPSWAPDSDRLAFERTVAGNTDVYVMDDQGHGVTRLTDSPALDEGPVFSPDAQLIAFTSERDGGNSEIYVMRADGSEQRALSPSPAREESPDWQTVSEPSTILLRVRPRRVREGRVATLHFTARARGRLEPVAGATVRFAGLRAKTDAQGRATIRKLMRKRGLFTAKASLRGHRSGIVRVRVVRRPSS